MASKLSSDALVLFGATGDLARRQMLLAPYDVLRHGRTLSLIPPRGVLSRGAGAPACACLRRHHPPWRGWMKWNSFESGPMPLQTGHNSGKE